MIGSLDGDCYGLDNCESEDRILEGARDSNAQCAVKARCNADSLLSASARGK